MKILYVRSLLDQFRGNTQVLNQLPKDITHLWSPNKSSLGLGGTDILGFRRRLGTAWWIYNVNRRWWDMRAKRVLFICDTLMACAKKLKGRKRWRILTPSCNFNFPIPSASLVFFNPHSTILVNLLFELSDAFILAILKPFEIAFVNQFCHKFLCIFVS